MEHKLKPVEMLAYARKAVELEPDKSFIRDTLGWACLRNGQSEEALQTFADVFDRFPFEAQGAASSWRGLMEIAQSPVKDEVLLAFCGKLVSEVSQPRTTDLDQDIVPVNFRAGTNHLLVKVCNTTLSWGFYLRLTDRNGQPIEGLKDD